MRAIVITRPGGPEVLELAEVPAPEPAPGEIRVRVAATAVNRADLLQRRGRYPVPAGSPESIPGLEYAGTVDATGPGSHRWTPGDSVMGLVGGGGYAEHVVVHEDEALRIPASLDATRAAALPEVFMTAHDALFTQASLGSGETLLVHAAGSGVGTAAIQLARAAGTRVIGTARSAWKLERARALGLDVAIDTSVEAFPDAVKRATEGRGVDVILDLVGGDYLAGNLEVATTHARVVIVGLVAGASAPLDMRTLMRKRMTLRGTVMRARPLDEKIAVARAFEAHALPLLESGKLQPVIDRVMSIREAAAAHALLEENETFGKVVLTWEG